MRAEFSIFEENSIPISQYITHVEDVATTIIMDDEIVAIPNRRIFVKIDNHFVQANRIYFNHEGNSVEVVIFDGTIRMSKSDRVYFHADSFEFKEWIGVNVKRIMETFGEN